jgi:hypothetical protein
MSLAHEYGLQKSGSEFEYSKLATALGEELLRNGGLSDESTEILLILLSSPDLYNNHDALFGIFSDIRCTEFSTKKSLQRRILNHLYEYELRTLRQEAQWILADAIRFMARPSEVARFTEKFIREGLTVAAEFLTISTKSSTKAK